MPFLKAVADGVDIRIKVVPGASRDRIAGLLGDALKVQVASPPEKGQANKAVRSLVAKALGIKVRSVTLLSGHTSPRKVLRVEGLSIDAIRIALCQN